MSSLTCAARAASSSRLVVEERAVASRSNFSCTWFLDQIVFLGRTRDLFPLCFSDGTLADKRKHAVWMAL